jgi:hypothetical protein
MTRYSLGSTVADMAMSSLRKVRDEAEARACLSALARSGKSLREWARSKELDGRSLRAWQINLSRSAPTNATVRRARTRRRARAHLVELVPVSAPSVAHRYVVRIGDASVELGDDFDASSLRRIVEALHAC